MFQRISALAKYSSRRAISDIGKLVGPLSIIFYFCEMFLCEIYLELKWIIGKWHFQPLNFVTLNPVVLSLTSYPPRFRYLRKTLKSLILQDYSDFKIVVNLAKADFDSLPRSLKRFRKFNVEFNRIEKDLKVYMKLLPVLESNRNSIIVTADDDIYYPKMWLSTLVKISSDYPDCIIGYRGIQVPKDMINSSYADWPSPKSFKKSSDTLLLTGVAGILYPEKTFAGQNDLILKLMTLSPRNDDLAYFVASNILGLSRVYFPCRFSNPKYWNGSQRMALWRTNVTGNQNESQYQALRDYEKGLTGGFGN